MEDLWYSEYHTPTVKFSIKVKEQICYEKSEYQSIAIYDSQEYGRFLTLDGVMMLTEKDEFIYHDMITHTALAVNPFIKNILVIGAGDGGVLRELAKYKTIENIDVVEIDERVIELSKKYLEKTAVGFYDNRVNIYIQDGIKFIRKKKNEYDLIIVDSTDPFGPGEVLFTKEFYGNCFLALKEDGILINQQESAFYLQDAKEMKAANKSIKNIFPISYLYQAHIPTYPSGHWLFGFASKKLDPIKDLKEKEWKELLIKTKYYNTDLHKGAFALPTYIKEIISNE